MEIRVDPAVDWALGGSEGSNIEYGGGFGEVWIGDGKEPPWQLNGPYTTTNIIDSVNSKQEKEDDGMDKMYVYDVIVVSREAEILLKETVVGASKDDALFNAKVDSVLRKHGLSPAKVTIICNKLGEVKVYGEPKRVEVEISE